jgi:hypothetical protein
MSFQAMAWASGTKDAPMSWGGPSGRAAIYAIANHASDEWFCWAKQSTLATESEQSPDSIQRRIQEFIALGRVRRIKLKRFGRRTHDFLILRPSPYFEASLDQIEPFLPRGCDIMPEEPMAAGCGSGESEEPEQIQNDSEINAAADRGSVSDPTLPQPALDATALVRQQDEPSLETESQPQTPSQQKAGSQGSEDSKPDLTGLDEFRSTYPRPSSKPDADAALWAGLTPQQRDQAHHGARGAQSIFNKNPKNSGVVGPTRFLQSEPLWAEYGRYMPAAKAPPPPRVFVPRGSTEWHARTVLCAIIGQPMPPPKPNVEHGCDGADFLGHLPPGGLVLAQFVDQFGNVDPATWAIIDRDKNRDQVGAWRERIRECTGREIELQTIDLGGVTEHHALGKVYKLPRRALGLRVPQPFPPPKSQSSSSAA